MHRAMEAADDSTIHGIHYFACWITKATDTHSDYGILTAFPLQQRLREFTSMYIAYLVCTYYYIYIYVLCMC
jgi:phenolic acid decarboxylase